jgi:hypothetical protein
MKIFIKWSQPFTSFHIVYNDLKLEEIELHHLTAQGQTSVFYYTPSGGGHPPQQQLPPRPPQHLPLQPQPPTMAAKAKIRARERGKVRTMDPATPATTAGVPRCDPPSTIPKPTPSRCGQGYLLHSSSQGVHRNTHCLLHRCTMKLLATPLSCPCRCLQRTNSMSRPLPGPPRWAHEINSHYPTPLAP